MRLVPTQSRQEYREHAEFEERSVDQAIGITRIRASGHGRPGPSILCAASQSLTRYQICVSIDTQIRGGTGPRSAP